MKPMLTLSCLHHIQTLFISPFKIYPKPNNFLPPLLGRSCPRHPNLQPGIVNNCLIGLSASTFALLEPATVAAQLKTHQWLPSHSE